MTSMIQTYVGGYVYHIHCLYPTEPGPSQVKGGKSVEPAEEGKESNSDDQDERCMVEEDGQSYKKDVDLGLRPI